MPQTMCVLTSLRHLDQALDYRCRIVLKSTRNSDELDDIKASLAALVFGDKGLGACKTLRHLVLGEPGLLSGGNEQRAKDLMLRGVDRLAHGAPGREREKLIPL